MGEAETGSGGQEGAKELGEKKKRDRKKGENSEKKLLREHRILIRLQAFLYILNEFITLSAVRNTHFFFLISTKD